MIPIGMTQQQFAEQMTRLRNTFGDKAFPDERVRLVWQEVKDFSLVWFAKQVDSWIGGLRYAPLITEVREACSLERERVWQVEKKQNAADAKRFFATFPQIEVNAIFQTINYRLDGKVSDVDFSSFLQSIQNARHPEDKADCSHCDDIGYVFQIDDKYKIVSVCYCSEGARKGLNLPVFSKPKGCSYQPYKD